MNSEKKRMNKTCKGCYAADTAGHPLSGEAHGCTLNYRTDGSGHPAEKCPKPKSWKQLKRETDKRVSQD